MNWMFMPYRRYFEFSGRSRRKEYWMWVLYNVIVVFALMMIFGNKEASTTDAGFSFNTQADGVGGVIIMIFYLFNLIPSIAVGVRRLHDTERSGWWMLLGLIPLVGLVLLVFFCLDGTNGPNKYGPDPKNPASPEVFA